MRFDSRQELLLDKLLSRTKPPFKHLSAIFEFLTTLRILLGWPGWQFPLFHVVISGDSHALEVVAFGLMRSAGAL